MVKPIYAYAALVLVFALALRVDFVYSLLNSVFSFIGFLVGLLCGFIGMMMLCGTRGTIPPPNLPLPLSTKRFIQQVEEERSKSSEISGSSAKQSVIVSHKLDLAIKEVFDLVIKDFVMTWYRDLSEDQAPFVNVLEQDMWIIMENLTSRLAKIDMVKFMTIDVANLLCDHFEELKRSEIRLNQQSSAAPSTNVPSFHLHSCLKSDDAEMAFLRQVSEMVVIFLAPQHIVQCVPARKLVREILTVQVLKPTVDMVCSPDYINQKILSQLEYREKVVERQKKTYAYAATYEAFIKLINDCQDLEVLKQIRYEVMTEIMHATTIQNLKTERGMLDSEKDSKVKGQAKGKLLQARNLTKYLNQCKFAKNLCEKRISLLGGPDHKAYVDEDEVEGKGQQGLSHSSNSISFKEIMNNKLARDKLMAFLIKQGKSNLLNFWNAVNSMKSLNKLESHQEASVIYQAFVTTSTDPISFNKSLVKGMEEHLVGNKGPEAFYEAQEVVYGMLDADSYPSFLLSKEYKNYVADLGTFGEKSGIPGDAPNEPKESTKEESYHLGEYDVIELGMSHGQGDSYTQSEVRLKEVKKKLETKKNALEVIKPSHKSDSKIRMKLEKELDEMDHERKQLENHIYRTDLWFEFSGHWKVLLTSYEVIKKEDRMMEPIYAVVVQIDTSSPSNSGSGWVLSKKLSEFHRLQLQLKDYAKWLKKLELPHKSHFKPVDEIFLMNSREKLEEFLNLLLHDEMLRSSEILYSFFVPTPEILIKVTRETKKKRFLSHILKGLPKDSGSEDTEDSEEDDSVGPDRRDSFAKPLYNLISEVCELKGMFKWLRRTLIMFVRITFGRTINRQLYETVDWMISESMVLYYITTFRDSMWPGGKLAPSAAERTQQQKTADKVQARTKLLRNIPGTLQNLIGKHSSKLGTLKLFNALQDGKANKHLFYTFLEAALQEVFPELREEGQKGDSTQGNFTPESL